MTFGLMNHPAKDVYGEINLIGKFKFDFLELTIEPFTSLPHLLDTKRIYQLLKKYSLDIIGHTCYYLQYASPLVNIRQEALNELEKYIDCFAQLNVKKVNIHTDEAYPKFYNKKEHALRVAEGLNHLAGYASKYGIQIMLEHNPGKLMGKARELELVFNNAPDILFHLDIGHAFIEEGANIETYFKLFNKRLTHVHLSDNNGLHDKHLPLGYGEIDWNHIVRLFKKYHYDGTFTLEIFNHSVREILTSKKIFTDLWNKSSA
jgi:sugar phosphate isomerase/epimerase